MIETQDTAAGHGEHLVRFYESDEELSHTVASYLAETLHAGGSGVVIATEAHRRAFDAALEAAGVDLAQAFADRTLVSLDAAETLASFMSDGRIDPEAFRRVIGSVVRAAVDIAAPVRAYGEMVALLWDAGDVLGAIKLEELWNDLAVELSFSLLCGYHSSAASDPEHAEALERVCHLHTSVLNGPREQHAHPIRESTQELSREFSAESDAPRAARCFVADALHQWSLNGNLLQDAQLVISELATNAVVHARSPFTVVARLEDTSLRLSVHDPSPTQPVLRPDENMSPCGRGLRVVAAITSDWGVQATGQGKAVWAELRR